MKSETGAGAHGACREDATLYRSQFEHDACGIGALANLKGIRTHQMVDDALSVLIDLEHRGGIGLEPNTGDGAGILIQVPHRFFRKEAQKYGWPAARRGRLRRGHGGSALRRARACTAAMALFEEGCAREGLPLLFWRDVPTDPHDLGTTARECMPVIKQAFLRRPADAARGMDFERRLLHRPPHHREERRQIAVA